MGRNAAKPLTAKQVESEKRVGYHADGACTGLNLQVVQGQGRINRSWLFRYTVEWQPKLSHFEENLHPNLSHPNRLSCLIFEQGWARSDQRGNFEQITQTCPSRQGLHPAS